MHALTLLRVLRIDHSHVPEVHRGKGLVATAAVKRAELVVAGRAAAVANDQIALDRRGAGLSVHIDCVVVATRDDVVSASKGGESVQSAQPCAGVGARW